MKDELLPTELEISKEESIIKVIGVGGGGGNAVNHMLKGSIAGVDFVVCNTDSQALEHSPAPIKVQLGKNLTDGKGAGNKPKKGEAAAKESLEEIDQMLTPSTKMVFITAGMGGGTGTGAAPVIAEAAYKKNILTVGIVTIPFRWEGKERMQQAIDGITKLEKFVDSLLIIKNEKLREMYGDLKLSVAFAKADNVLAVAAKSIAEIITVTGRVNVDFADVSTVMKDSGVAVMGAATAMGENRAINAIEKALDSPLLNSNNIAGAKNILLNIISGEEEILMEEITAMTNYLRRKVGEDINVIFGNGTNKKLKSKIGVTVIATNFDENPIPEIHFVPKVKFEPKIELKLEDTAEVERKAKEKREAERKRREEQRKQQAEEEKRRKEQEAKEEQERIEREKLAQKEKTVQKEKTPKEVDKEDYTKGTNTSGDQWFINFFEDN